jgi:hypothetical protein
MRELNTRQLKSNFHTILLRNLILKSTVESSFGNYQKTTAGMAKLMIASAFNPSNLMWAKPT